MSAYPLPYSVGVRAFIEGATDPGGDPIESWSAPVQAPVYGWGPAAVGTDIEPFVANRDLVSWELDLYVPPEFVCGPHDRIVVLGVEYEVEGPVQDYSHGPFGFRPGNRVRLKRAEG